MEVHLGLPVSIALIGYGDVVVIVATFECSFQDGSLIVAPTWIRIVIERHYRGDALP